MCGGIGYKLIKIPKSELKKFYTDKEILEFSKKGEIQSFYWSKKPILPIEEKGKVKLKNWGNRDKENILPQTGWAKKESIDQGKWEYLKPEKVIIPVNRGYEKGVWFNVDKGFQGIKINNKKKDVVYMITKAADPDYLKLTKHNRQPVEI